MRCPGAVACSGGGSVSHTSPIRRGQRVAQRQPGEGARTLGPDLRGQARTSEVLSFTGQYDGWFGDLREYVKRLGLSYATIDAIPSDEGLELLELNVNGTRHWLPDPLARTLTDAVHAMLRRKLARPV